MKRTKSLIASILGTVVTGVQVIVSLYMIFACIVLLGQITVDVDAEAHAILVMTMLLVVLLLLFLITTLILTCLTFKPISGSPEKYAEGKGVTIATIVFNFLLAILLFVIYLDSGVGMAVFAVICALTLIASNVLYIIDLAQEKERVEKFNKEQENVVAEPVKEESVKTEETKTVAEETVETKEEK